MRVAIVYLGNNAPKYVFDNLRYLRTNFPNINLVFISDSEKSLKVAKKLGAEVLSIKKDQYEDIILGNQMDKIKTNELVSKNEILSQLKSK